RRFTGVCGVSPEASISIGECAFLSIVIVYFLLFVPRAGSRLNFPGEHTAGFAWFPVVGQRRARLRLDAGRPFSQCDQSVSVEEPDQARVVDARKGAHLIAAEQVKGVPVERRRLRSEAAVQEPRGV